jgi:Raf kinase inhibitor-like YbhB/YbcL family protein
MTNDKINTLIISSAAFHNKGTIPSRYTCEGEDINPSIEVDNIPEDTKTLAIIVEDPDAPNGTFDHWLVWNLPPESPVEENRIPGISGKNGAGKTGYYGPCPPSGSHRYYFHVFALDDSLDLEAGADKKALQAAMKPHILAKGCLMGRYKKMNKTSKVV